MAGRDLQFFDENTLSLSQLSENQENVPQDDYTNTTYFIFLLRHYGRLQTKGDIVCVVDKDHAHILFRSSPKNSIRCLHNIVNQFDADDDAGGDVVNTTTLLKPPNS